jgi:hypothetical protein
MILKFSFDYHGYHGECNYSHSKITPFRCFGVDGKHAGFLQLLWGLGDGRGHGGILLFLTHLGGGDGVRGGGWIQPERGRKRGR